MDKLYLDGYHSEYHKCKMKAIKYSPTRNSQAAEQLWSRLDNFCPTVPAMSRAHYRYFWLNYAKWRNDFVRSEFYTADVCPMVTRKKFRLKTNVDVSEWSPSNDVVCEFLVQKENINAIIIITIVIIAIIIVS